MLDHLFDFSRGGNSVAACTRRHVESLKQLGDFEKSKNQCPQCEPHFVECKKWHTHCNICGLHIADGRMMVDHQEQHALSRASYRLERLAFVVSVQSHYDSTRSSARTLACALGELKKHFGEYEFTDPIPARHEIQRADRDKGSMLGESFVATYIIVQK